MAHEFTAVHRIEFADTDAAGMVHFTTFFRLMEVTEHAFYRSLGGSAFERRADGDRGMPRVSASCHFHRPLRYGDEVEVHLRVSEKTDRKLAYDVEFRARPDRQLAARGSMTVMYAVGPNGGPFTSAPLPDELARVIEVAPGG